MQNPLPQAVAISVISTSAHGVLLAKKLQQSLLQQGISATIIDADSASDAQRIFIADHASARQDGIVINANEHDGSAFTDSYFQQIFNNQTAPTSTATDKPLHFVAITACPTGVAHTFMAADALKLGAERRGYSIDVETQGSVGAKNILTQDSIDRADFVILATDIEVNTDRFVGKKVYRCGTGVALKQTDKAFDDAISTAQLLASAKSASADKTDGASTQKAGVYKHLLTGVSYMLPMVVAGGLLIALSFVFGINAFEQEGSLAAALMGTGKAAFGLMVPLLSGYIAYSIADRPGLAAGLIGGALAGTLGAGFLGGIAAGFLAGYVSLFLAKQLKLPVTMEALKPILIIPLLSSLVVGLAMYYVIGAPVAYLLSQMEHFLANMGTANAVILGMILAGMMCVDLGGPINKAAYAFSVGLLTSESYFPMAAAMAGGMVPAIGIGIATILAAKKFTDNERNAGKVAMVLGACFISEGAIPFAAKDPVRVIPCCIAGGVLTGALVALFDITLVAPHGGVFVLLIPGAVNHALMYLVAIAAGSVLTGVAYALVKQKDPALTAPVATQA
ncbi:fructose-specific PTS transporter subunit EIIC [Moraxella sp. FZFQ2102]|uniref:fructose-specific PTS transporter subunit EIIC n=1 Tax=Moraxella sp. FZFQ2102 TaxID=2953752 RepID=UPI00209C1A51|nr:fructose-specific PTS transporter subunit EIIC [Moraxella sp. FZFQ2102]USZ14855.1 fructose-specific PTS transporter subunit EIIC [Moraxella sp. FZFQ2102]